MARDAAGARSSGIRETRGSIPGLALSFLLPQIWGAVYRSYIQASLGGKSEWRFCRCGTEAKTRNPSPRMRGPPTPGLSKLGYPNVLFNDHGGV